MPVSRKKKNISKKRKNVKRSKKTRKHMKQMRGGGSSNLGTRNSSIENLIGNYSPYNYVFFDDINDAKKYFSTLNTNATINFRYNSYNIMVSHFKNNPPEKNSKPIKDIALKIINGKYINTIPSDTNTNNLKIKIILTNPSDIDYFSITDKEKYLKKNNLDILWSDVCLTNEEYSKWIGRHNNNKNIKL